MKGALLLGLVCLVHYGYPDSQPWASWWFYILRGIEGTVLYLLLARHVGGGLALVACLWGAFESFSTASCGYMEMGSSGTEALCLQAFGPLPYAVLGAILLVMLLRAWHGKRYRNG